MHPAVTRADIAFLPQLMTLGSGSYTQQSTSHAIARAQAFTRPSSNSPRALATHWHTAAAASGTVRVCLPGLLQNRATQDTSRASQSLRRPSNPTQPTHRPTLNYIIQQPASALNAIILTWTTGILASSKRNSVSNTAEQTHSCKTAISSIQHHKLRHHYHHQQQ